MALDLIVRNAMVPPGLGSDGRIVDIGVADGLIAAFEPGITASAQTQLNVLGHMVSPGLVESHIHLDKSRILDRCVPASDRGRDHMQRVSTVKWGFTEEDVYERASATLEQCLLNGTMRIRSHVEVDPNVGLRGFDALKQLRKDYRWAVDIELCVFAQEGLSNAPQTDANLVEALGRGASVIGGAPGFDPDSGAQIRRIFELAREFDVDVDIHLDAGHLDAANTADEMDIHLVCELTESYGWGGRVAIGHGTKYSNLPPAQLAELGARLADAGVAVTVLPATDLFLMGRHQDHAVQRGVTDAHALLACGVNCSLSTNNVLNPFTPFGDGSLVRMANLYAHTVQRGTDAELAECFAMITSRSAALIGRRDYGIALGRPADLVVWDARTPSLAVATVAAPLYGFKHGRRTFTRERPTLHRP